MIINHSEFSRHRLIFDITYVVILTIVIRRRKYSKIHLTGTVYCLPKRSDVFIVCGFWRMSSSFCNGQIRRDV